MEENRVQETIAGSLQVGPTCWMPLVHGSHAHAHLREREREATVTWNKIVAFL